MLREDPAHPSWITGWVTVREPEYTSRDVALLLADYEAENRPRGEHGVLMSEATDPANYGKFVAEEYVDYAQHALNQAAEERRKSMADPSLDYPLRWRVRLQQSDASVGDEDESDDRS